MITEVGQIKTGKIGFKYSSSAGFLLPTVIILATAIMILSTLALNVVAQSSATLNSQQLVRQAKNAADAGITAASNCIIQNSGNAQWSDLLPLTSYPTVTM